MRRTLRTKWGLVAGYWFIQAALAFLLFPFLAAEGGPASVYSDRDYITIMAVIIASVMACQAALLQPVRRPRPSSGSVPARICHAAVSGVAVGAMCGLAAWLSYIILEALNIDQITHHLRGWMVFWLAFATGVVLATGWIAALGRRHVPAIVNVSICAMAAGLLIGGVVWAVWGLALLVKQSNSGQFEWLALSGAGVILVSWVVATPLLLSFSRYKPPHTALGRISSRLLMGTLIEAAAVIPLDVMVRRKTDCYCGEGSLWSLTMCWVVGSLVLGPAMWLYPLRKRRLRWYRGVCPACGYNMRGCPDAVRCPECGAGWRSDRVAAGR